MLRYAGRMARMLFLQMRTRIYAVRVLGYLGPRTAYR